MAPDASEAGYPSRWEADVVLADGGTMSVRPIRPDDAELIVDFHNRQSPESIYFRFFSPRPQLSERDLHRFTHVDYVDRMAFVGLIGDELVGVARYDRHRGRSDAEVAFFIDDRHHGRGMATVLLEYLAAAARENGITGFTASVLPQNRKMLGVFTQAGFTSRSRFEEGVIEVELGIEPTPEALAAIEKRAATAEARSVERLLKPTSIAVVGASRDPDTIGYQVFHQLISHRFEGPVYPVNRGATYVGSVRAWHSVVDVPGELDLAVICVPADEVLRVAEECAAKRVQGLVVLSAGFAERDAAGEAAEEELVAYARRHGMRLIGPNALGVINTDPTVRMHATFVPVEPLPGRVGLVAQSGVIGAAVVDAARRIGLGISSFVAVGNKADVSSNDLLRYWQDDPNTDVALMYLESYGNPAKFARTARALSMQKPVIAVKVGGAVADSWDHLPEEEWPADETASVLLGQSGVIRVDNLTQMLHTAGVFADQPLPAGRRVAVMTNSWGPGWLAVDALSARGLVPLDPIHLDNLAGPEEFASALTELYRSDVADSVLVIYAPALQAHYRKVGAAVRDAYKAARAEGIGVTTVACLLGGHQIGLLKDREVAIPEFPFPEEAAIALGRVVEYATWRSQPVGETHELDPEEIARAQAVVNRALQEASTAASDSEPRGSAAPGEQRDDAEVDAPVPTDEEGTGAPVVPNRTPAEVAAAAARPLTPSEALMEAVRLSPSEAVEVLSAAGLAPVEMVLVDDEEEAVAAANAIGFPVALKATGLDRLSKTEAGGVSLDVHGDEEVRDAYRRMDELLGEAMHPAVVQAMTEEGVECRVSITRHPALGDVLTLGPGGASMERAGGQVVRLLPLTDADAERLIRDSVIGPLIREVDDSGAAERALIDLLVRVAALADAVPEISMLRLNPVMVTAAGAAITDVRVAVRPVPVDTRPPVRRL